MKRAVKITLISLASTLAAVVVVVAAAASVLMYVVFTPERLTPIVRKVAGEYVQCEHYLGEVDLTFWSTFPEFGVRVADVDLINPMPSAPNDTLLRAGSVVATVNVMALLEDSRLEIHDLILCDIMANAYVDTAGVANWDVFALPEDTTEDTDDTEGIHLPFDELHVDQAHIASNHLRYIDRQSDIEATIDGFGFAAEVESWDDIRLQLKTLAATARMEGETYLDSARLQLDVPVAVALDSMHFVLGDAELAVNDLRLGLCGWVSVGDTIAMDLHAKARKWDLEQVLALVPATYRDMLSDIEVSGRASLAADIVGRYSDTEMPLVDAQLELDDVRARYLPLPYTLRGVEGEADAHIDLNDTKRSYAQLRSLKAKTRKSKLSATGRIDEVLDDILLDLQLKADVHLPDVAYFLPEDMQVVGRAKGDVAAKIRLSDLTEMRLEKGTIRGDVDLRGIHYTQDDIVAKLPDNRLHFELPNRRRDAGPYKWLYARMQLAGLDAGMDDISATLGRSDLEVATADVLADGPLRARVHLTSEEKLLATMDSTLAATVTAPDLLADVRYDMQDTAQMPVVHATLHALAAEGHYDEYEGALADATLHADVAGTWQRPRAHATIATSSLQAKAGDLATVVTQDFAMEAAAAYDPTAGDNVLLQWDPKLNVKLHEGRVDTRMLLLPVIIPQIDFDYSNRHLHINRSNLHLGNSDFALSGDADQIKEWLTGEGELKGDFLFESDYTDINQLMAMFSAEEGSEEHPAEKTAPIDAAPSEKPAGDPFMVPTDMDVALTTKIGKADIFESHLNNVSGKLYVQDGKLVLDQMGFACKAASLQLTAMYRTPRKNHIYVGFDYHMLHVDIEELIDMIPQLEDMFPMLQVFKGQAEFHLAAETYTNAKYEPKMSTLRGACSLQGKDLVVLDNETFSTIAKYLMFKKKTENRIDSISAEATLYKDEIDVYPLCVQLDNYMVALGGRHYTDMTFNYDINVLRPIYLGVNVSGNLDDLNIKLAPCKFAQDFRPRWHGKVNEESANLRRTIRESMRKNVKIE